MRFGAGLVVPGAATADTGVPDEGAAPGSPPSASLACPPFPLSANASAPATTASSTPAAAVTRPLRPRPTFRTPTWRASAPAEPWAGFGNPVAVEGRRPPEHGGAVRDGARVLARGQRERVRLERGGRAGRGPHALRRRGGHRRPGRKAQQHGRAQLGGAPRPAGRAAVDVPVDLLAQRHREPPVPVVEHAGERGAIRLPGAADQQHGEAGLELVTGPGQQRVDVVAGHAEHRRDLGGLEPLPQLKLDDLALAGVQARGRVIEQLAQFGASGLVAGIGAVGCHVRGLRQRRRGVPGPRDPQGLVARHGEQPGPQPAGLAQPGQPGGGDDERVLHRVGRVGRVGSLSMDRQYL